MTKFNTIGKHTKEKDWWDSSGLLLFIVNVPEDTSLAQSLSWYSLWQVFHWTPDWRKQSVTHPPTHAPTTPVLKVRVRQKNSRMTERKTKNLQSRQGLGFRVLEFEAIWCVVHNATCVSIGWVEYNHVSVKLKKGDGSVIIIIDFWWFKLFALGIFYSAGFSANAMILGLYSGIFDKPWRRVSVVKIQAMSLSLFQIADRFSKTCESMRMCVNLKAFLQYLSMKVICHCLHTKTKLRASVAPKSLKLRRKKTHLQIIENPQWWWWWFQAYSYYDFLNSLSQEWWQCVVSGNTSNGFLEGALTFASTSFHFAQKHMFKSPLFHWV